MKVINDIISKLILSLADLYNSAGLHTALSNLIDKLDDWQTYSSLFADYMSGVYFLFGKALIIYIIGVFIAVFAVRLLFAVVNLIGQFVP